MRKPSSMPLAALVSLVASNPGIHPCLEKQILLEGRALRPKVHEHNKAKARRLKQLEKRKESPDVPESL